MYGQQNIRIELHSWQKHCLITLSDSNICLNGNVKTAFHESWIWKSGVSECDSNVFCFLDSEFELLIAFTVKGHWKERLGNTEGAKKTYTHLKKGKL